MLFEKVRDLSRELGGVFTAFGKQPQTLCECRRRERQQPSEFPRRRIRHIHHPVLVVEDQRCVSALEGRPVQSLSRKRRQWTTIPGHGWSALQRFVVQRHVTA